MIDAAPKPSFAPKPAGNPLAFDRQLLTIRLAPGGKTLAAGDMTGNVCRWSVGEKGLMALPAHTGALRGWVSALAFSPDGKALFAADSWGTLAAWSVTDDKAKPVVRDKAHVSWIRRLAVHPSGNLVATCSSDGRVTLSDAKTLREVRAVDHGEDVLSLCFDGDGRTFAAGDLRGVVRRYETSTGRHLRDYDARVMYRLDRIQDVGGVRVLAFSPDGKTLLAGGCVPTTGGFVQGTAVLMTFDAESGKETSRLMVGGTNDGYVNDAAWHPEGFVAAVTSGQPGTGRLLLHRPGEKAAFFDAPVTNPQAMALDPEAGRIVVAATNANSSGNGRPKTKDKSYPGNSSPLMVWEMGR